MRKVAMKVEFDDDGQMRVEVRGDLHDLLLSAGFDEAPDDPNYVVLSGYDLEDAKAVFGTDDPPCKITYKHEVECE